MSKVIADKKYNKFPASKLYKAITQDSGRIFIWFSVRNYHLQIVTTCITLIILPFIPQFILFVSHNVLRLGCFEFFMLMYVRTLYIDQSGFLNWIHKVFIYTWVWLSPLWSMNFWSFLNGRQFWKVGNKIQKLWERNITLYRLRWP